MLDRIRPEVLTKYFKECSENSRNFWNCVFLDCNIDYPLPNKNGDIFLKGCTFAQDPKEFITGIECEPMPFTTTLIELTKQAMIKNSRPKDCSCSGHTLLHIGCTCGYKA